MRRVVLTLATAGAVLTMAACGGGDVTVMAQLEQQMADGATEVVALSSLPVRLIPFDRDAIFDSLSAAYPEAEPVIPDSIFDLRERVIQAQTEWREAESRWALLRDSLQSISNRMEGMDQSSGEYFALFQEFNDMETEVNQLEEVSSTAFQEFNELQTRLNNQSREISIARREWADEAFASVDSIFGSRYEDMGLEELADTTGADGTAFFAGVPAGDWWVVSRYDRQFDELYWNVPIQVTSEGTQVELTEDNAEVRQKM